MLDRATATSERVTIALPSGTFFHDVDWSVGDRLAILVKSSEGFAIWTARPDGRELKRVLDDGLPHSTVRWSRRDDALYYDRWRDQLVEIVRRDPSPPYSETVVLTQPRRGADNAGLRDHGGTFTFADYDRELIYARSDIRQRLIVRSAGQDDRVLLDDLQAKAALSVSPSGRWLAFAAGTATAKRLYRIPAGGGSVEPIGPVALDILSAAWSPDETELAFTHRESARIELSRIDMATKAIHSVATPPLSYTGYVRWAPSRELLVALEEHRNVAAIDPASGVTRSLIADASVGWFQAPVASHDGRIAGTWNRPRSMHDSGIWMVARDGTPTRIATGRARFPLAWSRDDAWIYVIEAIQTPDERVVAISSNGDGTSRIVGPTEGELVAVVDDSRAVAMITSERQAELWLASMTPRAPLQLPPPAQYAAPPASLSATPLIGTPTNFAFDGEVGQSLTGWAIENGQANMVDACHRAGAICAQFDGDARGELVQNVDATPYRGHRVRLTLLVRTDRPSALIGLSSKLTTTLLTNGLVMVPPQTGWQRFELLGDIAADARYVRVAIGITEPGTIWVDAATLELVPAHRDQ
jgi:hypothetical protein